MMRRVEASVVEMFYRWNLTEADSFFLQRNLLLGSRRPLYISLLGFPAMDFQSFCSKLGSHVFKMLVKDLLNRLKGAVRGSVGLIPFPAFDHRKRRKDPFDLPVATDRAIDNARRLLFLEGCAVLEPAFKDVFVRTNEIVCNHRFTKLTWPQGFIKRLIQEKTDGAENSPIFIPPKKPSPDL
jgi:hypothetical protein